MSEVQDGAPTPTPCKPESNRCMAEEDRAWAQLYATVGQASTAEEVVKQLEADVDARRTHLALFLRAKATLRQRRVADLRNQRVGAFFRTVVRSIVAMWVVGPARMLRSLLSGSGDVAIAMLPPVRKDPAKLHVSVLTRDPEFVHAAKRFKATAEVAAPIANQAEESRGAKAA